MKRTSRRFDELATTTVKSDKADWGQREIPVA